MFLGVWSGGRGYMLQRYEDVQFDRGSRGPCRPRGGGMVGSRESREEGRPQWGGRVEVECTGATAAVGRFSFFFFEKNESGLSL